MRTLSRFTLALALPVAVTLAACGGDNGGGEMAEEAAETSMPDTQTVMVAEAGLQTPESVLYDADADVYLVSNINGAPTDKDGNGFISRVSPDGEVLTLKWIDGAADDVTLNAPKGLALKGDTLFVADIDEVRAFNRSTGAPLASWPVPGATFLNDLTVGPDGSLYVSDSGLNPDFSSSGTDAVYRFENGEPVAVVEGTGLGSPNGLTFRGDNLVIVGFSGKAVRVLPMGDSTTAVIAELPGGQLDGVVALPDGSLLVSSWETSSVYRVPEMGAGEPSAVVENVPSPADIGWDPERSRVLIPIFNENRLELRHISTS